jgi:4-amino-4-deoxy-L-arabinose transferase-like glycosyltransferase
MGPAVAKWSGFVTATSTLLVIAARAATPDSLLIACTTLAIYYFVSGARSAVGISTGERMPYFVSPNLNHWLAIYCASGLGVLAKGPIGVLLPWIVIWLCLIVSGKEAIWQRGEVRKALDGVWRSAWSMRPLLGLLVISVICGPWYLAIGIATDGVWLREFLITHHLGRATSVMEGHSGPPIVYYLLALILGTFPWSIWLLTSWLHAKLAWGREPGTRPTIVLAVSWIVVYVGFFSLSATKLPNYITPCLPGAALLFGLMLSEWADADRRKHRRGTCLLGWGQMGAFLGILVGASIMFAATKFKIYEESFIALAPLGMLFAITSMAAFLAMRLERPAASVRVFSLGSLALMVGVSVLVPTILDRSRGDLNYLMSESRNLGSRLGYVGEAEPSWVFYGGALTRIPKGDWHPSALEFLREGPGHVLLMDAMQIDQLRNFAKSAELPKSPELFRISEPIHSGMHDRVVHRVEIDTNGKR